MNARGAAEHAPLLRCIAACGTTGSNLPRPGIASCYCCGATPPHSPNPFQPRTMPPTPPTHAHTHTTHTPARLPRPLAPPCRRPPPPADGPQVAVERLSSCQRCARVSVPVKLVKDLFKKAVAKLQVGTS